jgi:hypothetical protein
VSNVSVTPYRERALHCFRLFYGARAVTIDSARDLLEQALRWRRLAEVVREPELASEMLRIALAYLELAERAQLRSAAAATAA